VIASFYMMVYADIGIELVLCCFLRNANYSNIYEINKATDGLHFYSSTSLKAMCDVRRVMI